MLAYNIQIQRNKFAELWDGRAILSPHAVHTAFELFADLEMKPPKSGEMWNFTYLYLFSYK